MNQTAADYEVIVVDDGSTDDSLMALEAYRDRIRLLALPHQGQAAACNAGFRASTGQYVVRVDSDDYVSKDFLHVMALFLEENKAFAGVCCDYWKVDEMGNRLSRGDGVREPIACGVMFRRECLHLAGLYNPAVALWEEREFMQRFLPHNDVYHVVLPLYRYCQHAGSLTHQ